MGSQGAEGNRREEDWYYQIRAGVGVATGAIAKTQWAAKKAEV